MKQLDTFKWFERLISLVCITIPVILLTADRAKAFRPSISDYVYMQHSYVFGMVLTIAAMLFIFNGAVYFHNETKRKLSTYGKAYNIVLGFALLMVVALPCHQFAPWHMTFAGIFFIGNAIVTGVFHQKRNRLASIILASLTIASLVLYFVNVIPSLLVAEWVSLCVIAVHFYLESR